MQDSHAWDCSRIKTGQIRVQPRSLYLVLYSSILALNTRFNKARMPQNKHTGRSHEPEKGHHGRGYPKQGKADNEESGVEVFLGYSMFPDLGSFRGCRVG